MPLVSPVSIVACLGTDLRSNGAQRLAQVDYDHILARVTEGFDTADLRDAKALLEELR
jgi:hypothetical protein